LEEEELISEIFQYVWNNKDKKVAMTDYEKCILLVQDLKDKVLQKCYEKWKEELKNGK